MERSSLPNLMKTNCFYSKEACYIKITQEGFHVKENNFYQTNIILFRKFVLMWLKNEKGLPAVESRTDLGKVSCRTRAGMNLYSEKS
jgi:hypothetical protein